MRDFQFCALIAGILAVTGCSLAPDYAVPTVAVGEHYKTIEPWRSAQPADRLRRDGWWEMYGDETLDMLQKRLIANNPDLSAATSHYAQAQAFVRATESSLYPAVKGIGNLQRDRQSDTRPLRAVVSPTDYNSVTLGAQVDYDLDLWGRVRDLVAAGTDEAQAEKADLASVQLSLQVQLAESYLRLRGLDRQTALLNSTVDAYGKALGLTRNLHDGGAVSGLDVSRARTQLSSARSLLTQNIAQRSLLEHAIASLVGASASDFSLTPETSASAVPVVPAGLPSSLLQRRPDIAAAERRVAAANAKIGVARSAYFPSITLSAQAGVQSSDYAKLLSAPSLFWAIGPALATYIFDGGKRRADLTAAKLATAEAGAHYRSVVLQAFQQVEDGLSLAYDLGSAQIDQNDAQTAAKRSEQLALARYKRGAVGYLDVIQAETASLEAQRSMLDLQTRQLTASVELIHALGGGWASDDLALIAEGELADNATARAVSR